MGGRDEDGSLIAKRKVSRSLRSLERMHCISLLAKYSDELPGDLVPDTSGPTVVGHFINTTLDQGVVNIAQTLRGAKTDIRIPHRPVK